MKSAPTLVVTVAACAALALSAAGCGEKQEPATTGPVVPETTSVTTSTTTTPSKSGSVLDVVGDFLASTDAQTVCDKEITPSFLRKTYGSKRSCLSSRKPANLTKKNYKIVVHPKKSLTTIVTVNPRDGRYAGKTLVISVLQQGTEFRIDSLSSNGSGGG